ncbi:hypothetical protein KAI04_02580 [Candidatus Pacearchaeota archaeon]|nr:hypothetical protein [Candidatus Pacearchaeota archaeon]
MINKRGQKEKISLKNFPKLTSKRGQEEMIGFGLIIIIVAVILLVFLTVSLKNSNKEVLGVNEVDSFIQSFLSYTTDCEEYSNTYYSIQDLIIECINYESSCLDGRGTCDVLSSTLSGIVDESWKISENTPIIGYELFIGAEEIELISFKAGNSTNSYKGSMQEFSSRGMSIVIDFTAYY